MSYQEATKAGTFNPIKIVLPVDYVEPEQTREYELGFKASTFDDRVNFSGALFLYRTKNLHTMYVSLLNGGVQTFESADRAQIHGVDFDLAATLLPGIVDDLRLNLGAAYLHARFTDFTDGAGYDPTTGLFTTDNDFTGNRIPRAPRFSSSASLSKAWDLAGGELELGGDYYWNSGYFYTSQNAPVAEQRGFDVLGARIAYQYPPWHLRVAIHGLNLLDETYSTGRVHTDFGSNVSLAPPRTWLLSIGLAF